MKAKKSPGSAPWGRNDDKTNTAQGKKNDDKGKEVQNQVITMSKQGQIGAVSINFKVFAWRCKPGSSSLRVSVWHALILIFKPFSF